MGEKTHGDLSKYNKKAERRINKTPEAYNE